MNAKLDPTLQAIVSDPDLRDRHQELTVIIALKVPAGPKETEDLRASGVTTRSIIGDIVTGRVSVANLHRLELIPWVVKVESSVPLGAG
jgi:hypothetical protein